MDWSAIYDESGAEDGAWPGEHNHVESRMSYVIETYSHLNKYSPWVCYMFTVNYILGVGCLGIPNAFFKSGVLLGSFIVVFISFISFITVIWVAEARRAYRFVMQHEKEVLELASLQKTPFSESSRLLDGTTKSLYSGFFFPRQSSHLHRADSLFGVDSDLSHEDVEVVDIVEVFLGPCSSIAYQISLVVLTFIGLVAYCQVFITSFISQIYPSASVYVPMTIFGAVVIPLSCIDLTEQVFAQVIMSVLRFLTLGILFFGLVVAIYVDPMHADSEIEELPLSAATSSLVDAAGKSYEDHSSLSVYSIPFIEFAGFGMMFSTAIFSQLFQHSVPGLIRPLHESDQTKVPSIFGFALTTTGVLYIATGVASVLYFGDAIHESINLNFVDYTWGVKPSDGKYIHIIARCLAGLIVLFPALDTLSVFPLIATTLGNNLLAAFPRWRYTVKSIAKWLESLPVFQSASPRDIDQRRIWVVQTTGFLGRFAAAVPPVLAYLVISDLSITLQLAGICGIIVALVTPALLQLRTFQFYARCQEENVMPLRPFYMEFAGKPWYAYIVIVIAAGALCVCTTQLVASLRVK
jgi:amino acid permease